MRRPACSYPKELRSRSPAPTPNWRSGPSPCPAWRTSKLAGEAFMGLKTIKIGEHEAAELACDSVAHRGEPPTAWFDCGSELDNLTLAMAAGWERRNANAMWLCPRCAHKNEQGGGRDHADKAPFGKRPPRGSYRSLFCRSRRFTAVCGLPMRSLVVSALIRGEVQVLQNIGKA
jgi:hypothetical protein